MRFVDRKSLSLEEAMALRDADFTYVNVGATVDQRLPSGYAHLRREADLGSGASRFDEAVDILLSWEMHRRAGLHVRASDKAVVSGASAILGLGFGRLSVQAPIRVVYLVDEPRRQGFAYGTLPGHPESGEEAFVLELHDTGVVTFTIRAFSRPNSLLARIGGPIGLAVQSSITNRYMRSV